ncbi:MAG: hypothetical protein HC847_25550 [Hydrococcus sp. RU_2_2]|nr:hypothetical protein [Hydrococcus sp. RU_2_2]NJP21899.1 hypothetical protein [Hydrococcus sp. CRU_1_1]
MPRGLPLEESAAAKRTLQKQRDKYPLLTDWIAQQQPTPEERILKADGSIVWQQQYWRDCDARCWRKWRARLYRLSLAERQFLLSEWNESLYPKTSGYFAGFCRRRIGAIDFNIYIQTVTNLPVSKQAKIKRFLDLEMDDPPIGYDPLTNDPVYFGDGIEVSCQFD